jgi:hypothetical protein
MTARIAIIADDLTGAPGLPPFDIAPAGGNLLRCVAKSGGFGSRVVLAGLLRAGRSSHDDQERTG